MGFPSVATDDTRFCEARAESGGRGRDATSDPRGESRSRCPVSRTPRIAKTENGKKAWAVHTHLCPRALTFYINRTQRSIQNLRSLTSTRYSPSSRRRRYVETMAGERYAFIPTTLAELELFYSSGVLCVVPEPRALP
jgi:hypothetical protein